MKVSEAVLYMVRHGTHSHYTLRFTPFLTPIILHVKLHFSSTSLSSKRYYNHPIQSTNPRPFTHPLPVTTVVSHSLTHRPPTLTHSLTHSPTHSFVVRVCVRALSPVLAQPAAAVVAVAHYALWCTVRHTQRSQSVSQSVTL